MTCPAQHINQRFIITEIFINSSTRCINVIPDNGPDLTYAAETWLWQKIMKEDWVFSKGNSFTACMVQYVKEGSGRRDTTENKNSFTINKI